MTTEKVKVLITGANGLLGANAARALFRKGYELRLLVRPSSDLRAISDIPGELFYGDICNAKDVSAAVKNCDYVVHTASITAQWGIPYDRYRQVNITGTTNVAEACLEHRIRKLIYISTANTIGPGDKNNPGTELNAFSLFSAHSGYINSKYVAQQYIQEQIALRGLPAVILNPTFMIGPYDVKPGSGQIILYGMNKKLFFYPSGGKNFVHVADVCTAIEQAIEIGKVGDFYLIAGENLSYKAFFKLLRQVSGRKNLMIRIPPLLLKIIGRAGSFIEKWFRVRVKLNYTSAYMLCLYNYYSAKKSELSLNLKYAPVDEAVHSAVKWFEQNQYIK